MNTLMLLIIITVVFLIIATILTFLLLKNMKHIPKQPKRKAQENEEETCVYLPLKLNPSVLIEFKKVCIANNTTHTNQVEQFIIQYIKEQENEPPKE